MEYLIMKKSILLSSIAVTLLSMGLVIGCGGSSGDSKGGSNIDGNRAALDTRSVETVGQNIAELIPGCVFTSNDTVSVMSTRTVESYRALYNDLTTLKERKHSRGVGSEPESYPGSCGGTMTTTGTDANKQLIFNNYCTGDATIHTTINGSLNASFTMSGSGEDAEPISITASTGSGGIQTTTVENGTTTTETLYLNNFRYNGTSNPKKLTITEFKIVSSAEGTFRLTDVDVNMYGNFDTGSVEVKNANYYDPEIGALTLSTSKLPIQEDAAASGWIKISRNGQSATFTTNDIGSGKFDVEQNGQNIGVLDCSATLTHIE
jgi:hypothetical protein